MDIKTALAQVVDHIDLSTDEMRDVMRDIMTGACTDAQIGAFLVGLRMKGESIDEITGAAMVMRELASGVSVPGDRVVDTCGTGGDGANIFNVSTAAALVVAAAGAKVAKHGNRAVSGKSGSADLLEIAGVNLTLTPEQVGRCVDAVGVGFMFAPAHHSAMKHAVGPRKELGLRTLFNMLGPMTNPAGVRHQVIGVFTQRLCRPMAEVLKRLGSGLSVDDAAGSLALINDALGKRKTEAGEKAADMIILNAGAALYACDQAATFLEGVQLASDALHSGLAREKLSELIAFTEIFREEAAL